MALQCKPLPLMFKVCPLFPLCFLLTFWLWLPSSVDSIVFEWSKMGASQAVPDEVDRPPDVIPSSLAQHVWGSCRIRSIEKQFFSQWFWWFWEASIWTCLLYFEPCQKLSTLSCPDAAGTCTKDARHRDQPGLAVFAEAFAAAWKQTP